MSKIPGAAANAAIIATLAAAFMPVSGVHVNPAGTLSLASTAAVSPLTLALFVPAQLTSAALAGVVARFVLGTSMMTPPAFVGVPHGRALAAEA